MFKHSNILCSWVVLLFLRLWILIFEWFRFASLHFFRLLKHWSSFFASRFKPCNFLQDLYLNDLKWSTWLELLSCYWPLLDFLAFIVALLTQHSLAAVTMMSIKTPSDMLYITINTIPRKCKGSCFVFNSLSLPSFPFSLSPSLTLSVKLSLSVSPYLPLYLSPSICLFFLSVYLSPLSPSLSLLSLALFSLSLSLNL